ncbi:TonB-dependent receptor [Aliifodinibius sp. S!AR15-10]|uniref:SusC/RagA family TonB-linked outer membrane protein n=1 Tax=Aliifodinibius sp. S!AR15-10 TaxID=2950437 RepID=UPI00285F95B1|nr:TonB-dependent receptor [Aliifodinibius sp. S!AR15-10]MDR8391732.1 TonB-dependent receptor [Aliifodinibius sp. S!AR15-10]
MKDTKADFLSFGFVFLALFLGSTIVQAQTVSGVVTDASSAEVLPGVNIIIKGTATGTATNDDGGYELTVSSLQDTLVFSFVGYQTQEVPIDGRTTINVALEVTELVGDDLVVVGYGIQRRADVTGSIGSVSEEDFNRGITNSPEQLIQGRVSGVSVTQRSGDPNSNSVVTIRGLGTVRSGGEPLYVVDGVTLSGGADFLNPRDIESIDVLKDASATAIYGSRGANGVIIITTKQGQSGAPELTYNGTLSISSPTNTLDVLNAQEFIDFQNQYGDPSTINSTTIDTDWQDEILRTAYSHEHSLSYGGGTQNSSYYASVNLHDQEGIVLESARKRYTGRLNVNQSFLDDRLNIGVNLTGAFTRADNAPIVTGPGTGGDGLSNAVTANPTYPTHNEDGSLFTFPFGVNPLQRMDVSTNFSKSNRILGNIEGSFTILEGLQYKLNFGADNLQISSVDQTSRHNITGGQVSNIDNPEGRLETGNAEQSNILFEQFVTYLFDIENHSFNLLGGYSFQKFTSQATNWSINNFSTTEIDAYRNPSIGTDLSISNNRPNGNASENELQSFFGRANYNYDDTYFLTATFRADGSSRFGENNRYGYFPSFSVAWQVSNESFLSGAESLSNLRLRAGWGQTGNQDIPSYITHRLLSSSTGAGAGYFFGNINSPGINLVRAQNENIKWEVSTQTNIGLDFGFLDDRIYGTVDVFRKISSDILWESSTGVDPIVPTSSFWNNYDMEIENKGIELSLAYRQFIGSHFSFDIGGNVSLIDNNITNLPVSILRTGSITGQGLSGVQVNGFLNDHPAGTFWVLDWIGFDEDGLNQFRDVDGDGSITDGDLTDGGTGLPNTTYGGYINMAYKGFDLSLNFNGVSGNSIYWNDENAYYNYPRLAAGNNAPTFLLENAGVESTINSATPSDRYIYDGSYFRLNNATIGYNVNTAATGWLKNIRVYVTGQNLFVITDYPGFDPEVDINRASAGFRSTGIDATAYPRARTFMFGVNFTL